MKWWTGVSSHLTPVEWRSSKKYICIVFFYLSHIFTFSSLFEQNVKKKKKNSNSLPLLLVSKHFFVSSFCSYVVIKSFLHFRFSYNFSIYQWVYFHLLLYKYNLPFIGFRNFIGFLSEKSHYSRVVSDNK